MLKHQLTHSNETSFACKECGLQFNTNADLFFHHRAKHTDKANEKNSKPPEDMPGQKNQGQKCHSSIENEETFAEVSIKEEAIVE